MSSHGVECGGDSREAEKLRLASVQSSFLRHCQTGLRELRDFESLIGLDTCAPTLGRSMQLRPSGEMTAITKRTCLQWLLRIGWNVAQHSNELTSEELS